MPRPRNSIPKFSVDRNGRAFTKVDGRFISLGRGEDPESRQRYAAVLTAFTSGVPIQPNSRPQTVAKPSLSLNELFVRYVTHELPKYSKAERYCQTTVIRLAQQLYGE